MPFRPRSAYEHTYAVLLKAVLLMGSPDVFLVDEGNLDEVTLVQGLQLPLDRLLVPLWMVRHQVLSLHHPSCCAQRLMLPC